MNAVESKVKIVFFLTVKRTFSSLNMGKRSVLFLCVFVLGILDNIYIRSCMKFSHSFPGRRVYLIVALLKTDKANIKVSLFFIQSISIKKVLSCRFIFNNFHICFQPSIQEPQKRTNPGLDLTPIISRKLTTKTTLDDKETACCHIISSDDQYYNTVYVIYIISGTYLT